MAIQFLSGVNITGTTSVSSVSNDNSTYTGILVWDGGLLKYRTTAQILSDIGATGNTGTVTSVTVQGNTGLSGSGTITTSGTITLTNSDRGSSQSIFKTISVSGQSSITASSNTDTLKLTGTGGTTITTNASTNTVTISSVEDTNNYVSSLSWNVSSGVLTAARSGLSSLTVDLDGRYATSSGVTSVSGTGSVSGLTLSGTVTSTGNLTLGGTLSLTSGNVTTALGFTPYNATNPSGFTNVTNNNQITNGSGYTTNTGTTTASNSQTFTNKGGNISQWTNNSGYITSASMIAAKGSWYPSAVQNINSGGTVGTRTTLSLNTASITARGMSLSSSVVTITDEITALISMNFASTNYATANRTLAAAVVQYRASSGEEWVDLQGTQVYNYDRGTATSSGASTWGFVYNGSGGASVLNLLEGESELRVQFWIEGRASSASGISTVIAGCRLSITEIK